MNTNLQKLWMKDLPIPVITLAKKKAVEATEAWNDTVSGILKAAKAVYEVREKIGGAPTGAFSAWAVEELKRSQAAASQLSVIGSRHAAFSNVLMNLPPSWGTLYELAKAPDEVFQRALRRVKPDMQRREVVELIHSETVELRPKQHAPKRTTAGHEGEQAEARAAIQAHLPQPEPRQAARLTILTGSLCRLGKDVIVEANLRRRQRSGGRVRKLAAGAGQIAEPFLLRNKPQ